MFRKNTTHLQRSFFDIENQLSESKKKKIKESEEYSFCQLIFKKIKEEDFAVLYSENGSRPNSAVNIMVSAIILLRGNIFQFPEQATETFCRDRRKPAGDCI